jgi:hypothetical protein
MITVLWGCLVMLGVLVLIWYFDTCYEVYLNQKNSRKSKKDRDNERFIQKVDRYYHEV